MTSQLLTGLAHWLSEEQANPNMVCQNDPELLNAVSIELGLMRHKLLENINDEKLWEEYKELQNALVDLLTYRVNKYARLKEGIRAL